MIFEMSEEDYKKAEVWMKEREIKGAAIGGQFSFVFIPTSLGMIIKVVDCETNEELDLTDYSEW